MIDRVFSTVVFAAAALVVAALVWVLTDVVSEGAARISWAFLVTEPRDAGRAGGIAPVLVSTLWVLV
ncbi:MAG: hypothetical protein KAH34_08805, partial [Ketobacter sp.]|nr:hypothetical protein [Ketobacter sp.]